MKHTRERVAADLRARLAEIFALKVSDPRLDGFQVCEVQPSPDFSFARVFWRVTGDREEAEAALASAKGFVRHSLAEVVQMRRVPELDFRFDESPDRAERIDAILDEVAERPPADRDEEGSP